MIKIPSICLIQYWGMTQIGFGRINKPIMEFKELEVDFARYNALKKALSAKSCQPDRPTLS